MRRVKRRNLDLQRFKAGKSREIVPEPNNFFRIQYGDIERHVKAQADYALSIKSEEWADRELNDVFIFQQSERRC